AGALLVRAHLDEALAAHAIDHLEAPLLALAGSRSRGNLDTLLAAVASSADRRRIRRRPVGTVPANLGGFGRGACPEDRAGEEQGAYGFPGHRARGYGAARRARHRGPTSAGRTRR